jgi:hypothetical protein
MLYGAIKGAHVDRVKTLLSMGANRWAKLGQKPSGNENYEKPIERAGKLFLDAAISGSLHSSKIDSYRKIHQLLRPSLLQRIWRAIVNLFEGLMTPRSDKVKIQNSGVQPRSADAISHQSGGQSKGVLKAAGNLEDNTESFASTASKLTKKEGKRRFWGFGRN